MWRAFERRGDAKLTDLLQTLADGRRRARPTSGIGAGWYSIGFPGRDDHCALPAKGTSIVIALYDDVVDIRGAGTTASQRQCKWDGLSEASHFII
jgi:hypothetical protein